MNRNMTKVSTISLLLIFIFGIILRFYYLPYDIPIVSDGFLSFVYAMKTVSVGELPLDYSTTNSGWANFLSLIFTFSDKTDPINLMNIQRIASIVFSALTVFPIFFILKKFVNQNVALLGSLLFIIEPRLLLISIEGINYSLFFFLFTTSIVFFLKKTYFSFYVSFACIALATLVRYEAFLLVIPFTIMYLSRFRDKRSILKFLGVISIFVLILASVGLLRMQATENICVDYTYGNICGENGFTNQILSGFEFIYINFILENQIEISQELDDYDEGIIFVEDTHIIQVIADSATNLGKFLILSLIPYFGFFILHNILKRKKESKIIPDFNLKFIIFSSAIMLLPAFYAYMREIDEIRYVLILIPLFCIFSVSFRDSIIQRIFRNKGILMVLVLLPIILSIGFIEFEKKDDISNMESFRVAQKITSLTDITNIYPQAGYIKAAELFNEWPELPDPVPSWEIGVSGYFERKFELVSTKGFDGVEDFIEKNRSRGLEYLVIDNETMLFDHLRNDIQDYGYLEKVFDSKELGFKNEFIIYKINFQKFEEMNI